MTAAAALSSDDRATALFASAVRLHRAGKVAEALEAYRGVLEIVPRHTGALSNMGVALAALGRAEDAAHCYHLVLEVTPGDADVLCNLGNLMGAKGDLKRAEGYYRRALEAKPGLLAAAANLGEILAGQGIYPEAIRHYTTVVAAVPQHIDARVRLATLQHANNELVAAATTLATALAMSPQHEGALLAFGDVCKEQGDVVAAERSYRAATSVAPDSARGWQRLGGLLAAMRPADAIDAYAKAYVLDPRDAESLRAYGQRKHAQGDAAEAERALKESLAIEPAPESAMALGVIYHDAGRFLEAFTVFEKCARRNPDLGPPLVNAGLSLLQVGEVDRARSLLAEAVRKFPNLKEAHDGLGSAYLRQGRLAEALREHRESLALNPASPEAMARLALTILVQPQHDDSEALALAEAALAMAPNLVTAHWARTQALIYSGRVEDGLVAVEKTLALSSPKDIGTLVAMAGAFESANRRDDAARLYRAILSIDPQHDFARAKVVETKLTTCDWTDYDAFVADQIATVERAVADSGPINVTIQDLHNLPVPPAQVEHEAMPARRRLNFSFESRLARWRNGERWRLRVGYAVPFTHFASFPKLHQAILSHHDRDRFEVFGYAVQPSTGTEFDRTYRTTFEHFRDIPAAAPDVAGKLIHDDQIDVLIDVTGHTAINCQSVMAVRPAPVQVELFASSYTTGANYIDFLVTDAVWMRPEFAQHCTERLVYMPDSMMVAAPAQMAGYLPTRAELGLPQDGFVLCNFNQPFKFDPSIFALWMRILRRLPKSVLWLGAWDETTRRNLRAIAEQNGVAPDRIVFSAIVSQGEHLSRLRQADLMVDNRYHGGGVTSTDGLAVGVPLLTRPGDVPAASTGASLAMAMGVPEMAVTTLQEYEDRAVQLGTDRAAYAALRSKVAAARTSALFDLPRYTAHLETAIEMMWTSAVTGTTGNLTVPKGN